MFRRWISDVPLFLSHVLSPTSELILGIRCSGIEVWLPNHRKLLQSYYLLKGEDRCRSICKDLYMFLLGFEYVQTLFDNWNHFETYFSYCQCVVTKSNWLPVRIAQFAFQVTRWTRKKSKRKEENKIALMKYTLLKEDLSTGI